MPLHGRRWRIAVLLGVGVVVNYLDRVNISVAHDALRAEFGISLVTFGYLLSSFNWTYTLLQMPMGVWLDRFGVKNMGRFSSLLWSVASFGAAISPNLGFFFANRLLLGVGEAPSFPANAKAVGDWFPPGERSFATSIFDAAAKLAPAIAVPAVGGLLLWFGWRASFAATGIASLFFFLAFYLVYRDPAEDPKLSVEERRLISAHDANDEAEAAGQRVTLAYLLTQRKMLGLVSGFFGYNYCFYVLLLWLPTYFSGLHVNPRLSIFYSSIPWVFATLADLLIGGWLTDTLIRRGRDSSSVRKIVLIGGTLVGLAIAGPAFTKDPLVGLCWITLSLVGLSAAAPVGWSIPALIAPRGSVGKAGSILNTGNQLSGIIAPIVTGYVASAAHSFSAAFLVAAVVLLSGVLGYVFLLGRIEKIPSPPVALAEAN